MKWEVRGRMNQKGDIWYEVYKDYGFYDEVAKCFDDDAYADDYADLLNSEEE